jgi:hypothetical protein
MIRFESKDVYGCEEQWNVRDTNVYTGLDLHEDKNCTFCVRRLYYDCLRRDPLFPSFYMLRGEGLHERSGVGSRIPTRGG